MRFCFTAIYFSLYRNDPKFSDTQNICCNHSKVWTMWLYHTLMSPNDADGMANSVDPDQTAPLGAVWSGSALFAQAYLSQFRIITELIVQQPLHLKTFENSNLEEIYHEAPKMFWKICFFSWAMIISLPLKNVANPIYHLKILYVNNMLQI